MSAPRLTHAQWAAHEQVCHTNGGGVSVRCKVTDSGEVVPVAAPMRKLFNIGFIQGKAGAFERVVHTRDGLAAYRTRFELESPHG